jgi:hypothetical protein
VRGGASGRAVAPRELQYRRRPQKDPLDEMGRGGVKRVLPSLSWPDVVEASAAVPQSLDDLATQ